MSDKNIVRAKFKKESMDIIDKNKLVSFLNSLPGNGRVEVDHKLSVREQMRILGIASGKAGEEREVAF